MHRHCGVVWGGMPCALLDLILKPYCLSRLREFEKRKGKEKGKESGVFKNQLQGGGTRKRATIRDSCSKRNLLYIFFSVAKLERTRCRVAIVGGRVPL